MKKTFAAILALLILVTSAACSKGQDKQEIEPNTSTAGQSQSSDLSELTAKKEYIEIVMEDGHIIKAELYPDLAPVTVQNFLNLVDKDFFAGLIFHRVIPGFMIQGGGFTKSGKSEKMADSIYGEFEANGFKNDLKHTRGVLSMARTQVPDSASSQFFIMVDTAEHLDGQYAAFGMVTEGMDEVDKIVSLETDENDRPLDPPAIKTIRRAQ